MIWFLSYLALGLLTNVWFVLWMRSFPNHYRHWTDWLLLINFVVLLIWPLCLGDLLSRGEGRHLKGWRE